MRDNKLYVRNDMNVTVTRRESGYSRILKVELEIIKLNG